MSLSELQQLATWSTFGLLTAVHVLLLAGFRMLARARQAHSREPTLDGRNVGYSPQQVFDAVNRYGPQGRRLYLIQLFTLDLVYPLVYAAWMAVLIGIALRALGAGSWAWIAAAVPFLGALVDYAENILIALLLWKVPGGARPQGLARAASSATASKWRFGYLSLGLVLLLGAAALISTALAASGR
jgi:hypothetical protein